MTGPARAGVLIYAKDLNRLSRFYQTLLSMRVLKTSDELRVIASEDSQLLIHAIPPHIAATIAITTPPEPREEQAIKPFFTVSDLAGAEAVAVALGGFLFGPVYDGPGFKVRNGCDPEGNIFQLRESTDADGVS